MSKGEEQKRLSLTTIERAAMLFFAEYPDKIKNIPEFIWFLERVNSLGIREMRNIIEAKLKSK